MLENMLKDSMPKDAKKPKGGILIELGAGPAESDTEDKGYDLADMGKVALKSIDKKNPKEFAHAIMAIIEHCRAESLSDDEESDDENEDY